MGKTALVVGASGIVGSATAALLLDQGWTVHGLARQPAAQAGLQPVAADLRDAAATAAALRDSRPDAVFITTWLRQDSEAENIRVNAAMVRNLLDGLPKPTGPRHVALVTGLKHYLGPFEAYGKGALPQTPFREEQGRLDVENFYYAQEDEVFAAAARDGFTWSVHRPHTVIGKAVGNAMNMGTHARRLCDAMPRDRAAVLLPGLGGAMERADRHDRCAAAGAALALGGRDRGRARPGVQRGQRRRLPLEMDVGPDRRLVRSRGRAVRRRGPPVGAADGR